MSKRKADEAELFKYLFGGITQQLENAAVKRTKTLKTEEREINRRSQSYLQFQAEFAKKQKQVVEALQKYTVAQTSDLLIQKTILNIILNVMYRQIPENDFISWLTQVYPAARKGYQGFLPEIDIRNIINPVMTDVQKNIASPGEYFASFLAALSQCQTDDIFEKYLCAVRSSPLASEGAMQFIPINTKDVENYRSA